MTIGGLENSHPNKDLSCKEEGLSSVQEEAYNELSKSSQTKAKAELLAHSGGGPVSGPSEAKYDVSTPKSKQELPTDKQLGDITEFSKNILSQELAKDYNATFSKDNGFYNLEGWYNSEGKSIPVRSRSPSLTEMQVAKSALERFGLKGSGIEFVFLDARQKLPNIGRATYVDGKVFIPPDWNIDITTHPETYVITRKPLHWFQKDTEGTYRQEGTAPLKNISVEGFLVHELGHYIDQQRDSVAVRKDAELGKRYGFLKVATRSPEGYVFNQDAIVLKNNDLYLPGSDGNWRRRNRVGQTGAGPVLNFDQIRDRALIRPGTIYSVNAREASADNKTCLYIADESRKALLKNSKDAYLATASADQEDIDFIDRINGYPDRRMRAFNGRLVKRTEANLRARQDIEMQLGLKDDEIKY